MSKGNPNDSTMKNNFVTKIYDPTSETYRPIYIAPDATSSVRGDVYLSDATDGTDSAGTGVTAATPKAVKTVNDNANTKLSMTTTTAQTVASAVTFSGKVTGTNGFAGTLTGDVKGNADTATKLKAGRTVTIQNGDVTSSSPTFDGTSNITISLDNIDVNTLSGVIPLANLPTTVMERMKTVANEATRYALTADTVQEGDTVYQADTKIMYLVVDADNLGNASGYQEYSVGTAARLGGSTVGSSTEPIYLVNGVPTSTGITIAVLAGATATTDGTGGTVPAPVAGQQDYFLRGDGTWDQVWLEWNEVPSS